MIECRLMGRMAQHYNCAKSEGIKILSEANVYVECILHNIKCTMALPLVVRKTKPPQDGQYSPLQGDDPGG